MFRTSHFLMFLAVTLWVTHANASLYDYPIDCSREYVPSAGVAGHIRLMAREAADQLVTRDFTDKGKAVFTRILPSPDADKRQVNFLLYLVESTTAGLKAVPWPALPVYLFVLYHYRAPGYGVVYSDEFKDSWIASKFALIPATVRELFLSGGMFLVLARTILQQDRISFAIVSRRSEKVVREHVALLNSLLKTPPSKLTRGNSRMDTFSSVASESSAEEVETEWEDGSEMDPLDLPRIQAWLKDIVIADRTPAVPD